MKYLLQNAEGAWQVGAYIEYLESIRDGLPAGVQEFAFEPGHYELNHRRATHDCRFDALTISEKQVGDTLERSYVTISARFLGSYRDSYLELEYHDVWDYYLTYSKRQGWM